MAALTWPFSRAVFTATSEQCASGSIVTFRQALAELVLIADGMMKLVEPREDRTSSIETKVFFSTPPTIQLSPPMANAN